MFEASSQQMKVIQWFFPLLLVALIIFSPQSRAQEKFTLYEGNLIVRNGGYELTYALPAGDEIILSLSTVKDKKLKEVKVESLNGTESLFDRRNATPFDGERLRISKDGVYRFFFKAGGFANRLSHIKIERVPGADETKYFNSAWEYEAHYDSTLVEYQTDSLTGYAEPVLSQTELKVFNKYVYQTQTFMKEHKQLLGRMGVHNSQSKTYTFVKPTPPNIPGVGLKHISYVVSSKIGGAKHWQAASIGTTIAATFMNPAAGLAANQAMQMMGPEPGGEPTRYYFSTNPEDGKTIHRMLSPKDNAKQAARVVGNWLEGAVKDVTGQNTHIASDVDKYELKAVYHSGSVTSLYSVTERLPDKGYLTLGNFANATAKNTDVIFNAIWFAPVYSTVLAEQRHIDITTVPVNRSQIKIETRKEVKFLK